MTGLLPILACLLAAPLLSGVKNGDGERMTHEWKAANVGVAAPDANDQEMSLPRRKILCLQVKQFDFFAGKALEHPVFLLSQGFQLLNVLALNQRLHSASSFQNTGTMSNNGAG